jgi:hypothetical protein
MLARLTGQLSSRACCCFSAGFRQSELRYAASEIRNRDHCPPPALEEAISTPPVTARRRYRASQRLSKAANPPQASALQYLSPARTLLLVAAQCSRIRTYPRARQQWMMVGPTSMPASPRLFGKSQRSFARLTAKTFEDKNVGQASFLWGC